MVPLLLKQVQSLSLPNVPVMLVGNKCDELARRTVHYQRAKVAITFVHNFCTQLLRYVIIASIKTPTSIWTTTSLLWPSIYMPFLGPAPQNQQPLLFAHWSSLGNLALIFKKRLWSTVKYRLCIDQLAYNSVHGYVLCLPFFLAPSSQTWRSDICSMVRNRGLATVCAMLSSEVNWTKSTDFASSPSIAMDSLSALG